MLERLQLFEAAHVGVGCRKVGHRLLVAAGLHVRFLLGNGVSLAQVLPAIGGYLRNVQLSGNLLASGARLHEFLVDFRCIDLRQ